MKMKLTLSLAALFLLAPADSARAQDAPPAPPAVASPPAAAVAPAPPAMAQAFLVGDNFLGVHVEEVTRENMGGYGLAGEPRGVAVTRLVKGGPAERAGLREKDVILRFDGEAVTSVRKLNRLIDESAPEHEARLTISRGGSQQELKVKLGRRGGFMPTVEGFALPPFEGEMLFRRGEEMGKQFEELRRNHPGGVFALGFGGGRRIGVSTSTLGKQLADYFGVPAGVLVNSVEEGSPAAKAGLKAGDVVTEAEGEKVEDAGDLSRLVNRKEEGEVTLTVVRERARRTVKVTPERRQPQTFNLTPGVYAAPRIAAAVAPPAMSHAPRAARAVIAAPRISVTPPRAVIAMPHGFIAPPRTIRMRPDRVIERRVL